MILVPIRTKGGLNSREHWRARAKRVRSERDAAAYVLAGWTKPTPPLVVTLTRLGPSNGLDDDNLAGSLKAIRDELAAWFGVDDRKRDVIRYHYEQERAKEWGVRIEFAPMPAVVAQVPGRLPHEWDDDACCIHCGYDGAEAAHLVKHCGYEKTDADRYCERRNAA